MGPDREPDVPQILRFVKDLAIRENMLDSVAAVEDLLREWIFEKQNAEVILAEKDGPKRSTLTWTTPDICPALSMFIGWCL